MIDLYANIGIGHENDWDVLMSRIIAAAQCNSDAVIITKSTPNLIIPESKKYVSITSKWGNLPYLEVAKKSEIDDLNIRKFNKLTEEIGIPVIWCITDTEAGDWVKEHTNCSKIKIHYDAKDNKELIDFCIHNFHEIILPGNSEWKDYCIEFCNNKKKERSRFSFYHTTNKFPSQIEELNLNSLNKFTNLSEFKIGYEGRCTGIFPDCAVVFKDVDFIEKYLGDEDQEDGALLSHSDFYNFFLNMNQLEIANGKKD